MMDIELKLDDARVRGVIAGLRPYRSGGPRLEVEHVEKKIIAHNYGHGGSGITLAWGSCLEILRRLEPELSPGLPIGVLGCGVMGLCSAHLLSERGHPVTIYSKEFPPNTTSNVAGGLWAPTPLGLEDAELRNRMLRETWNAYLALDSEKYGVSRVPMYETPDRSHPLDPFPEGLTPVATPLPKMPISGYVGECLHSETLLIETPRFLNQLKSDIEARDGIFRELEFNDLNQLEELPESVFINCLGLGAGRVAGDDAVMPIRGQLVLLEPASESFIIDHSAGYVISRPDVLVLGGTFEEGVEDSAPDAEMCRSILSENRRVLLGKN